jgi:fatty-acyl-CoA synthase
MGEDTMTTAPDIGLGNWFLQRSRRTPNRKALTFEGKTATYAELQNRFDRLATALRAAGVCRGDRVAFIDFNQPSFFEVMFATARLGAIFVPLKIGRAHV